MGYWVDMDDAYRTMDPAYVESVWWSLKQIHDKGLLVEDHRVAPYCPRCGTGLSDHELAQGYETVIDPSVYVRFPLTSGPLAGRASLLVWTTTPWTLVSNTAVAVHPERRLRRRHRRRGDRSSSPSRCSTQVLGEGWTVAGRRSPAARWSAGRYQRPFELVDFDAERPLRRPRRLRHHRGRHRPGAPVPRLRRGRHDGLPRLRPAGGQPGPPDGHFDDDVPLVGGLFFKKADAAPRDGPRGARRCCSATSPTSTPTRTAGAATPRCSTTPSRPGTSAPRPSRTRCCARTSAPTGSPTPSSRAATATG